MSEMLLTMLHSSIRDLLLHQVASLFPIEDVDVARIEESLPDALARCEKSFRRVRNKYYNCDGQTKFDPLHGGQWAFFLYSLANTIHHAGGYDLRQGIRLVEGAVWSRYVLSGRSARGVLF